MKNMKLKTTFLFFVSILDVLYCIQIYFASLFFSSLFAIFRNNLIRRMPWVGGAI